MMSATYQAVQGQSVWTGESLENDPTWRVQITEEQQAELKASLALVKKKGLGLRDLSRESFPLGVTTQALAQQIVDSVKHGRGFIVLRGFPVQGQSDDDIRLMYLGLSQYLGTCISQDPQSVLIADVKEKGIDKTPLTRAYGSKHPTRLHVDLGDVVGLLGVRQAPIGALSTIASSTAVYNEFVRQHPEWLPLACEGFHWDRFAEQKEWEEPYSPTKIPVFSFADNGQLSVRYNRSWINAGALRRDIPFTEQEQAVLDFFDATARSLALTVRVHPGDLYFANNYMVLHGRDQYEESADTPFEHRRLFLRVWFNIPQIRRFSDEAIVRFGLSSHGNIGWTSRELTEGKNLTPGHQRVRLESTEYA
jgi:hypothetical protein